MSKPRNPLGWYVAVSPEYTYIERVCDDGSGPTYSTCDVCLVEAHTKREAQIRAVKHWKQQCAGYLDNAENPFTGVKIEPADPEDDPENWSNDDVVPYPQGVRP